MAAVAFTIERPRRDASPVAQEISARMDALNTGQAFLAEYCGFNQSELSRFLSGDRALKLERVIQIQRTLTDLEALVKIFRPGRLVWDVPSIKTFVQEFVKKPEAGKQLEKSFAILRGGMDALGEKL